MGKKCCASGITGSHTLPCALAVFTAAWLGSVQVVAAAEVVGWGDTNYNQCAVPPTLGSEISMLAGGRYHSIALRNNGTIETWGEGWGADTNEFPTGLGPVMAIAAGYDHNLALEVDGTVAAWGGDNYLQCSIVDGMSNVMAIAAGHYNSVVLQADGTVTARGQYINYTTDVYASNTTEVIALASGTWHDVGLRADGTLVDLRGGYVPAGMSNIVAIAAGTSHGLGLLSDGTVTAWNTSIAVPAEATNVIAIAAKGSHNLALKADGTVVAWGVEYYGENTVPDGLSDVTVIGAGLYHSLALGEVASAVTPTMHITNAASSVRLSWEPNTAGFILQQADVLSTNTAWSDAPSGSTNPVVIPIAQPACYYRLHQP